MLAIRSGTGGRSYPERYSVGCVRWNGCDSAEQQRGESYEATSSGNVIKRAAENASEEKKDCGFEAQVQDVSRSQAAEEAQFRIFSYQGIALATRTRFFYLARSGAYIAP